MKSKEQDNDFSPRLNSLLQRIKDNTQNSENGLGRPIKSIDMSQTGIGKEVVSLRQNLYSMGLSWKDAGASDEESRYLEDLFHGEVGQ
ncbi:MAG: hypothetical protein COT91_01635 [Candidatus Doudnabacteria bacterium CG10_big_fil_rev_8_21_14_0_10_41_10]|uniref:Uncharacterized protein n=1 Tax=Candidatus Doudnabacteria bacterium CG10_big_fil_rev_8_21_14_0_10_41_10 TaxID=1974551 RepID=A0A2H0VGF8_9BACT|nr:MAG: hypothetical protein COT91_01635 [Candidatus Doudnabacteria bacterium CG10_big_fil_rev_8_21_14_0_10_41_10]